jgi:hypothetical protein
MRADLKASQQTWEAQNEPFGLFQWASSWGQTRNEPVHDRRLRHLAAAMLWDCAGRKWRFTPSDELEVRTAAAALDMDQPARAYTWHLFHRKWLVPRVQNCRDTDPANWGIGNLPGALSLLWRSRSWMGLQGLLHWCVRHEPSFYGRPLPVAPMGWVSPPVAALVRDVYPRPHGGLREPWVTADVAPWRTGIVVALARQMWESREFSAMPILADALQDAGCDDAAVLLHCRNLQQPHCRGCWVLETILRNKEWPESRRHKLGMVKNGRGEYLTECVGVYGRPRVFDVRYRTAGDPDGGACHATADELDERFPGWETIALPARAAPADSPES